MSSSVGSSSVGSLLLIEVLSYGLEELVADSIRSYIWYGAEIHVGEGCAMVSLGTRSKMIGNEALLTNAKREG